MKSILKKTIPDSSWNTLRNGYDAILRLPEMPAAYLHPWRRESIKRLKEIHNIHSGKRAFIIGNGPSLKNTNLSKLKGEVTFGLNRIYLMFPELGFQTTYLVSINDLVIEQCAEEMLLLNTQRFFAWHSRRFFVPFKPEKKALPTFLYTTYTGPGFSREVSGRVWEGATVTNVALQIAFHMGFEQVILIGVDHNFTTKGPANTTVTSQGDDPNHFSPAYFGKGFRWQLPDLETSEIGYRFAKQAYETAGRKVVDATVEGKLTVFPKAEFGQLFK
jgi:hypothetical protein